MDTEPTNRRTRTRAGSESPERLTATDRLPPQSSEAEKGVLGCMLLDTTTIGRAVELLKEGEETFYDLRHQMIYKTVIELWNDRDPVDLITLYERLKAWGLHEQCGGLEYLSNLPDTVPSAQNIDYYIEILREKYLLRRMIKVCTETVSKLYEFEGDTEKVLDECERDVLRVNESRVVSGTPEIKELVKQSMAGFEIALRRDGSVVGLKTGFPDLDRLTFGLNPSDMIVIAARPGVGKTAISLNIADSVAVENRIPVGICSLEMSGVQLTNRLISARARVNLRNLNEGFVANKEFPKITNAASRISAAPIYIDDTGGQSILQVRAKARRWWQQYGIKLLIIDYLQLMNALGGRRKLDNRQQEVSDISNGVKSLAKELNIPVIVLSQLNRDIEKEKNRNPRLSDLRESGSIEADADIVILLNQSKSDDEDEENNSNTVPVNVCVAKNRNGPTGLVSLTFFKEITRFESSARVTSDDVPTEVQETMV